MQRKQIKQIVFFYSDGEASVSGILGLYFYRKSLLFLYDMYI